MAILLCGITMSHYAHFNLSPMGQVAVQQVFRVLALIAGKSYFCLEYAVKPTKLFITFIQILNKYFCVLKFGLLSPLLFR